MKRGIITFVMAVIATISVNAQRNDGTSMLPIMKQGEEIRKLMEEKHEMEIVRIEYDIIRTTKESFRTLSSDWTYQVIAFGDYRVKDIDVEVYRRTSSGGWTLVGKDNDASSVAVVKVTPSSVGDYKIVTRVYSFEDDYDAAHYGLFIVHD